MKPDVIASRATAARRSNPMKKILLGASFLMLIFSLGLGLYALSGGSFNLDFLSVNSGGGSQELSGGNFALKTTMGASGASAMSGGNFSVTSGFIGGASPAAAANLGEAHAYPVPFMPSQGHTNVTFTDLTSQATIKIYTLSGELVTTLTKADTTDSLIWNVRNDAGEALASGVYIYTVESSGELKKGKLMVIK